MLVTVSDCLVGIPVLYFPKDSEQTSCLCDLATWSGNAAPLLCCRGDFLRQNRDWATLWRLCHFTKNSLFSFEAVLEHTFSRQSGVTQHLCEISVSSHLVIRSYFMSLDKSIVEMGLKNYVPCVEREELWLALSLHLRWFIEFHKWTKHNVHTWHKCYCITSICPEVVYPLETLVDLNIPSGETLMNLKWICCFRICSVLLRCLIGWLFSRRRESKVTKSSFSQSNSKEGADFVWVVQSAGTAGHTQAERKREREKGTEGACSIQISLLLKVKILFVFQICWFERLWRSVHKIKFTTPAGEHVRGMMHSSSWGIILRIIHGCLLLG